MIDREEKINRSIEWLCEWGEEVWQETQTVRQVEKKRKTDKQYK